MRSQNATAMELFMNLNRMMSMDQEPQVLVIRGERVMIDEQLARMDGVSTKQMNQQVRRNRHRFPDGFLLELTPDETRLMRSQIVTASRRNIRHSPFAFTEHGSIMLATVLNTPVAIEASVRVVRAFVKMREMLTLQAAVLGKLDELEGRVGVHDVQLRRLFGSIRRLVAPRRKPRGKIGFGP